MGGIEAGCQRVDGVNLARKCLIGVRVLGDNERRINSNRGDGIMEYASAK
jgi:hypothetical protein